MIKKITVHYFIFLCLIFVLAGCSGSSEITTDDSDFSVIVFEKRSKAEQKELLSQIEGINSETECFLKIIAFDTKIDIDNRKLAINSISDETTLLSIFQGSNIYDIKAAALNIMHSQEFLMRVASDEKTNYDLRIKALDKINEESSLHDILINTKRPPVASYVASKITDGDLLSDLLKEIKSKDVKDIVKNRINQISTSTDEGYFISPFIIDHLDARMRLVNYIGFECNDDRDLINCALFKYLFTMSNTSKVNDKNFISLMADKKVIEFIDFCSNKYSDVSLMQLSVFFKGSDWKYCEDEYSDPIVKKEFKKIQKNQRWDIKEFSKWKAKIDGYKFRW